MKGRFVRGLERFFLFQNSTKMAGSRSSKTVGESLGGFTDLPLKDQKKWWVNLTRKGLACAGMQSLSSSLQASLSDQVVGVFLMVLASAIFAYYSIWVMVLVRSLQLTVTPFSYVCASAVRLCALPTSSRLWMQTMWYTSSSCLGTTLLPYQLRQECCCSVLSVSFVTDCRSEFVRIRCSDNGLINGCTRQCSCSLLLHSFLACA